MRSSPTTGSRPSKRISNFQGCTKWPARSVCHPLEVSPVLIPWAKLAITTWSCPTICAQSCLQKCAWHLHNNHHSIQHELSPIPNQTTQWCTHCFHCCPVLSHRKSRERPAGRNLHGYTRQPVKPHRHSRALCLCPPSSASSLLLICTGTGAPPQSNSWYTTAAHDMIMLAQNFLHVNGLWKECLAAFDVTDAWHKDCLKHPQQKW